MLTDPPAFCDAELTKAFKVHVCYIREFEDAKVCIYNRLSTYGYVVFLQSSLQNDVVICTPEMIQQTECLELSKIHV